MNTQESIALEVLRNYADKPVGIYAKLYDQDRNCRYSVTCRYYNDHSVWYCKRRTPASDIFVDSFEMDRVIDKYNLKEAFSKLWEESNNDEE